MFFFPRTVLLCLPTFAFQICAMGGVCDELTPASSNSFLRAGVDAILFSSSFFLSVSLIFWLVQGLVARRSLCTRVAFTEQPLKQYNHTLKKTTRQRDDTLY